jgi:hypothetical protein
MPNIHAMATTKESREVTYDTCTAMWPANLPPLLPSARRIDEVNRRWHWLKIAARLTVLMQAAAASSDPVKIQSTEGQTLR